MEYPGRILEPGSIRLVQLLPGNWTDPIRYELFDSSLMHAEYQALSYVWGSKNVKRSIFLSNSIFPVTVNLESALRHLREQLKDDDKAAILWVDALCINQADDSERTTQVQMMRSIYERCQRVIVYLGDRLDKRVQGQGPPKVLHFEPGEPRPSLSTEGHEDIAAYRGLCLLHELVEEKHLADVKMLQIELSHNVVDGRKIRIGKDRSDRLLLIEALRKMMQPPFTPWWSRIWTVQEIAVAKKVFVTYRTISAPWSLFAGAAARYLRHSTSCCSESVTTLPTDQAKVLADSFRRILGIDELKVGGKFSGPRRTGLPPGWSLLDLLRRFRDRRATDPRDKIYALLSLASKSYTSTEIIPDYTLSEIEVFCQATLACIHQYTDLSVFSTELGRKFRDDLPSWVPDWGAPGGSFYEARAAATELYSACPSIRLADAETVKRLAGGKALELDCFYLASIEYIGEIMWGGDVPGIWRDTLWRWWEEVTSFENTASTSFRGDFWRLICGDVICNIGAGDDARRVRNYDELTFVAWALESSVSPDLLKYDLACSEDVKAWRDYHLLWPHPSECFPNSRLDSRPRLRSEMIRNCLANWNLAQSEEGTGPYDAPEAFTEGLFAEKRWLFASDAPRRDAPWDQFGHGVKRYLDRRFDQRADIKYQRELLPVIDRSITTAILSRRLIKAGQYVGLGPTNTRVGDKSSFLLEARRLLFYVIRMPSLRYLDRSSRSLVTATFKVQWTRSSILSDTNHTVLRSLSYNHISLSMP